MTRRDCLFLFIACCTLSLAGAPAWSDTGQTIDFLKANITQNSSAIQQVDCWMEVADESVMPFDAFSGDVGAQLENRLGKAVAGRLVTDKSTATARATIDKVSQQYRYEFHSDKRTIGPLEFRSDQPRPQTAMEKVLVVSGKEFEIIPFPANEYGSPVVILNPSEERPREVNAARINPMEFLGKAAHYDLMELLDQWKNHHIANKPSSALVEFEVADGGNITGRLTRPTYEMRLTFSEKFGFMLSEFYQSSKTGTKIHWTLDWQKVGDVWFPLAVNTNLEPALIAGEAEPRRRTRGIRVTKVSINELPEGIFELDSFNLPADTLFIDKIANTRKLLMETDHVKKVVPSPRAMESLEREKAHRQRVGEQVQTPAAATPLFTKWHYIALGITLLAAGLFYWRRRKP